MLPTFFLIGANKAGTTSLHRYLAAHPAVFMSSPKEPEYFALRGLDVGERPDRRGPRRITTAAEYEALFDAVDGETAVGEASTVYLRSRRAAEGVHAAVPDARIVAVLRDPIERARSAHAMYVRKGFEPLTSFDEAVEAELAGADGDWRHYVKLGEYHEGLVRWFDRFDRDRIRIHLFDDLGADPLALVRDLYEFLQVDPSFTPDVSRRYNVDPTRQSTVRRLTKAVLRRRRPTPAPVRAEPPSLAMRARLAERYQPGVAALEQLIDRDLSTWLVPPA